MEEIITNQVKKKVTKQVEKVSGAKERKGRPALRKKPADDTKDDRDKVRSVALQYKSLVDWNRKLEHMHTILTNEESSCKFV
jgi:hypothetical protein